MREEYVEKSLLRLYQIAGVKELKLSVIYGLRTWKGINRGELKAARKKLGIQSITENGERYWRLP